MASMKNDRVVRPNRSDVHLSSEEEAKIERETRNHFDSLAPKRHSKPHRSDSSDLLYIDDDSFTDLGSHHHSHDHDLPVTFINPELAKLKHLENHTQKLVPQQHVTEEEYMETEYYKDLNCIDKQHHTTGTGFIKVMDNNNNNEDFFSLSSSNPEVERHFSSRGNPATNDWIPVDAAFDTVMLAGSHKPNRSDL